MAEGPHGPICHSTCCAAYNDMRRCQRMGSLQPTKMLIKWTGASARIPPCCVGEIVADSRCNGPPDAMAPSLSFRQRRACSLSKCARRRPTYWPRRSNATRNSRGRPLRKQPHGQTGLLCVNVSGLPIVRPPPSPAAPSISKKSRNLYSTTALGPLLPGNCRAPACSKATAKGPGGSLWSRPTTLSAAGGRGAGPDLQACSKSVWEDAGLKEPGPRGLACSQVNDPLNKPQNNLAQCGVLARTGCCYKRWPTRATLQTSGELDRLVHHLSVALTGMLPRARHNRLWVQIASKRPQANRALLPENVPIREKRCH